MNHEGHSKSTTPVNLECAISNHGALGAEVSIIEALRYEQPRDEQWGAYVNAFRGEWEARQNKATFTSNLPQEDVAIVLAGLLGESAVSWFDEANPALDGRTPAQVARDTPGGIRILRSLLMRMHA